MNKVAIIHMIDHTNMVFVNPKQGKNYSYDQETFYLNAVSVEFAIPYSSIYYIEFTSLTFDELAAYKDKDVPIHYLKEEEDKNI